MNLKTHQTWTGCVVQGVHFKKECQTHPERLYKFTDPQGDTYLINAPAEYLAWSRLSEATATSVDWLIDAGVTVQEMPLSWAGN